MPATNKTTNFNLPQFIATDIPTWLDDVNDAMLKIDTALQNIKTTGSTNKSDISKIETNLQTINSSIASANGNITTLQSSVNSLNSQVTKLNNQFNLTKYELTPQIYAFRNNQYVNVTSEYSDAFPYATDKIPLYCNEDFSLFKIIGQWCFKSQNLVQNDNKIYLGISLPEGFIKNNEDEEHFYKSAIIYQRSHGVQTPYFAPMTICPSQNLLLIEIPNIVSEYSGDCYAFGNQALFINQNLYVEHTNI